MTFEAYIASSSQKRLYLVNRMYGDSILYNIPNAWIIEGNLEPQKLERAFKKLVKRHESLRTSFLDKDGKILQVVHHSVEFEFKIREALDAEIESLLRRFPKPFNLDIAPLWHIELVRLGPDKHVLLFDIHHTVADGTSIGIFIHDLMALYHDTDLPSLDYQYVDFTMWQNKMFDDEFIFKQEDYWLKMFEENIPLLDLPTDFPRPLTPEYAGHSIETVLDTELTQRLNSFAKESKTTLYVILLSIYNILLSKHTGQEDITVGGAISGRSHKEFESIIGMFINTLALRNKPAGNLTFDQFLETVSKNTFDSFNNQDYPFEMLVEKLAPQRQVNRSPLIDTLFVLQNFAVPMNLDNRLRIVPFFGKEDVAKFDLSLTAYETSFTQESAANTGAGQIVLNWNYRASLFNEETIRRMAVHFETLVREITETPKIKLGVLDILSELEKQRLLVEFNDTSAEYPTDKTIHALFEQQAAKTPDRIALIGPSIYSDIHSDFHSDFPSEALTQLTYNELNTQADQLAGRLIEKGIRPETIVALKMERSVEMIVGILGILKSGAAYLPIDPSYPQERIDYMLKDSDAKMVLSATDEYFKNSRVKHLLTNDFTEITVTSPLQWNASNMAYIIYTSGSTGKPKGVVVEHRSVVNLITDQARFFNMD